MFGQINKLKNEPKKRVPTSPATLLEAITKLGGKPVQPGFASDYLKARELKDPVNDILHEIDHLPRHTPSPAVYKDCVNNESSLHVERRTSPQTPDTHQHQTHGSDTKRESTSTPIDIRPEKVDNSSSIKPIENSDKDIASSSDPHLSDFFPRNSHGPQAASTVPANSPFFVPYNVSKCLDIIHPHTEGETEQRLELHGPSMHPNSLVSSNPSTHENRRHQPSAVVPELFIETNSTTLQLPTPFPRLETWSRPREERETGHKRTAASEFETERPEAKALRNVEPPLQETSHEASRKSKLNDVSKRAGLSTRKVMFDGRHVKHSKKSLISVLLSTDDFLAPWDQDLAGQAERVTTIGSGGTGTVCLVLSFIFNISHLTRCVPEMPPNLSYVSTLS